MNNKIATLEEASRYFAADIPDDLKKWFENAIERELEEKQHLKKILLKEAERHQPRYFHQLDGIANMPGYEDHHPENLGDCIESCYSWELNNMDNEVRVLIHEDSKPQDVIRLLEKICQWIESDPKMITNKANRNMEIEKATRESFNFLVDVNLPF